MLVFCSLKVFLISICIVFGLFQLKVDSRNKLSELRNSNTKLLHSLQVKQSELDEAKQLLQLSARFYNILSLHSDLFAYLPWLTSPSIRDLFTYLHWLYYFSHWYSSYKGLAGPINCGLKEIMQTKKRSLLPTNVEISKIILV